MTLLWSRIQASFSSFPGLRLKACLPLVLAVGFAYRQLILFDPNLHAPSDIEALEGLFFSTAGVPPLLIYGLAGWFTGRRVLRFAVESVDARISIVGWVGTLVAMGLVIWAHYTTGFQVLPLSLAILLVSVGLLLGGGAGAYALLMPALFIVVLGTPIPTPLLNQIIYPMQLWTAEVSVGVVRMSGFAVQQAGDLVVTPWGVFQVIESCAGLGMVQTLIMAAFAYGELVDSTRIRHVVLIIMAPLLGLVINFARVLLLVIDRTPESQTGHSLQGIVMVIVGVLMIWGLDVAMDRLRVGREATGPTSASIGRDEAADFVSNSRWRIWAMTALCILAGTWGAEIEPWRPDLSNSVSIHAIPRQIFDWKTGQQTLIVDDVYLGSARFSSRTWRRYERGQEEVTLFAGLNDRVLRFNGLVSDKTKTLNPGSMLADPSWISADPGTPRVKELIVQTRNGESVLVHHWYENTEGLWIEAFRSAFAIDQGPGRRTWPSGVVRVATPVELTPGDLDRARRRLREFSELIRVEIERLHEAS